MPNIYQQSIYALIAVGGFAWSYRSGFWQLSFGEIIALAFLILICLIFLLWLLGKCWIALIGRFG